MFLDNCNAELLSSNVLAQVISESAVMTRVLGHSRMVRLTTNAFIALTGNGCGSPKISLAGLWWSNSMPNAKIQSSDLSATISRLQLTRIARTFSTPCSRFGGGAGKRV